MTSIVCVPDLLRGTRAFPEGFFDLIREPVAQGSGIDIGHSIACPRAASAHGFDVNRFTQLLGLGSANGEPSLHWARNYHELNCGDAALDYLFSRIPPDTLVLAFEMPPWLQAACDMRGVRFLDLRASPLRFGRDLYVALATSDKALTERIDASAVCADELKLEAALLAANVQMHLQRLHEHDADFAEGDASLDDALIFVGQAPFDASILCPRKGRPLRVTDFAKELRTLAGGRHKLLHKPHPFAIDFGNEERAALGETLGREVETVHFNAYQILSSKRRVALTGISSGLLQEARWFGKEAHVLFEPFVPLACDAAGHSTSKPYHQIRFQDLIAPAFWHGLLTPERPAPRLAALPLLPHHHARETLDHWWDYEKVLTWRRSLPHAAFERLGGGLLRQRIGAIEDELRRAIAERVH